MLRIFFVFVAIILLMLAGTCSAADLEVRVVGLKSQMGDVHIALFNAAEHFPYSEGVFLDGEAPIRNDRAILHFADIAPGTYGIAVYHDENDNDSFDQGVFGIPLEDYGFSNNASGLFGPPDFKAARFDVSGGINRVEIDLAK